MPSNSPMQPKKTRARPRAFSRLLKSSFVSQKLQAAVSYYQANYRHFTDICSISFFLFGTELIVNFAHRHEIFEDSVKFEINFLEF